MITPEEFILQEKWYEIYEKDEWGYLLGYYTELLKNIGHKLCITHEKLTKEESSCWYGYKFMDYVKSGFPLIIIATVVSMIILPIAFPFFP